MSTLTPLDSDSPLRTNAAEPPKGQDLVASERHGAKDASEKTVVKEMATQEKELEEKAGAEIGGKGEPAK